MKIQQLPPNEAARLVPLLQDLHSLHVAHHPDRYQAEPKDETLTDWLQDWLQEDSITALTAQSPQGALMGYVVFGLEDRPALPVRFGARSLMVHHIAVAAPFRRIGVGAALLAEVQLRAKALKVTSIATSYAPFNTASQALFASIGLEPITIFAERRI